MSKVTLYAEQVWGFGGLGNWKAMVFPYFLLAASGVMSLHPIILPWSPTLAKPDQPQKLVHGAATLLGSGQIQGMENGRDLYLGSIGTWQRLVSVAVYLYKTCSMLTERMNELGTGLNLTYISWNHISGSSFLKHHFSVLFWRKAHTWKTWSQYNGYKLIHLDARWPNPAYLKGVTV